MLHTIGLLAAIVVPPAFIFVVALLESHPGQRRLPAPQPVNVVYGVVLPEPDDPRWELLNCAGDRCNRVTSHIFHLGEIHVRDCCAKVPSMITVGGACLRSWTGDDQDPYYLAVKHSYCSRKAQESIEGTPERPCLPPAE